MASPIFTHDLRIERGVLKFEAGDKRRIPQYVTIGKNDSVNVSQDVPGKLLHPFELSFDSSFGRRMPEAAVVEETLRFAQRGEVVKLNQTWFGPHSRGLFPLIEVAKKLM